MLRWLHSFSRLGFKAGALGKSLLSDWFLQIQSQDRPHCVVHARGYHLAARFRFADRLLSSPLVDLMLSAWLACVVL